MAKFINYRKLIGFFKTGSSSVSLAVVNSERLCYKCCVPTEVRKEKLTRVLASRQPDLQVVLEEVSITHNASAVARTCEAVGALNLHIISSHPDKGGVQRSHYYQELKMAFDSFSSINKLNVWAF